MPESPVTRKDFVRTLLIAAVGAAVSGSAIASLPAADEITVEDLKRFEKIAGISFSDDERKSILNDVRDAAKGFDAIRREPITFTTEPSTSFRPLGGGSIPGAKVSARPGRSKVTSRAKLSDEDIAFLSVRDLGHLIRTRQISPVELTKLYLARLKKYGDPLLCVVTLTESLALEQAAVAEREISDGHYRGPLHGIPYGIKDLFATKGIPTTWGADPYKNQVYDFDATVVERLREAGAILCAKLSMGALAQGDVWFRGTTKNPWDPRQGSSGSSAGSASATAAGLVGFAIGTETLGSIVSPSTRCRVTGLRPTYGRTSRYGGMALSYTMDKVGPICREAEDCALVLAAICGSDARDPSAVDRAFNWPPRVDFKRLKIGWLTPKGRPGTSFTDDPVAKELLALGALIKPIEFSPLPEGILQILEVESASAFDAFTRSEAIHELKNSSWPETFRANRFVPAVEYLQAQRARTLLMHRFEAEFGDFDAFLAVGGGYTLAHTNLTGHPQIVIPVKEGIARSLTGRLYREDVLVAIAKAVQDRLGAIALRPDLSKLA